MTKQRKRGPRHDATGRSKGGEAFIRIHHSLLNSPAWQSLTPAQRCVYLALCQKFNGLNNGTLFLSVRDAAEMAGCNKDTAAAALKALQDRGFIAVTMPGAFSMKVRHASEFRLTAYPGPGADHGTRDYLDWRPEKQNTVRIKGTHCPD